MSGEPGHAGVQVAGEGRGQVGEAGRRERVQVHAVLVGCLSLGEGGAGVRGEEPFRGGHRLVVTVAAGLRLVGVHLQGGEQAAVALPVGYVGLVHPRSGLAAKLGVTVLNAPGTVDAGYRGEILVNLINHDPRSPAVKLQRSFGE